MGITGNEKLYVSEGNGIASMSLAEIAANMPLPAFTTLGGNTIPAGTLTVQLQAIANLADPS